MSKAGETVLRGARQAAEYAKGKQGERCVHDAYRPLDKADGLDDESRAALHRCLDKAMAELKQGLGQPAGEFLDHLDAMWAKEIEQRAHNAVSDHSKFREWDDVYRDLKSGK